MGGEVREAGRSQCVQGPVGHFEDLGFYSKRSEGHPKVVSGEVTGSYRVTLAAVLGTDNRRPRIQTGRLEVLKYAFKRMVAMEVVGKGWILDPFGNCANRVS